jgi:hypothetical protein
MRGWVLIGLAACSYRYGNDEPAPDAYEETYFDASTELPECDRGPIACPTPDPPKLTICGQLYDFETNSKLAGFVPSVCDPQDPMPSGACALKMVAYDGVGYIANPGLAKPLPLDSMTIDKCGRFRFAGINTNGTGPFIGVVIDDAGMSGAAGLTVPVLTFTPKIEGKAEFTEAWIVSEATTTSWTTTGGPSLSNGIFAALFRKHRAGTVGLVGLEPQAGVTLTKSNASVSSQYFSANETDHLTIDPNATATGANGTGVLSAASISDSVVYSGSGGLGPGCRWQTNPAATLPGHVFIELFRKVDELNQVCGD